MQRRRCDDASGDRLARMPMSIPGTPTHVAGKGDEEVTREEVERRRGIYHQALANVVERGQAAERAHANPENTEVMVGLARDQSELHRVFFEAARDIHDEQERRAASDDAARVAKANVTIADAQLKAAEAQANAAASQAKTAQDGLKIAELSAQAAKT